MKRSPMPPRTSRLRTLVPLARSAMSRKPRREPRVPQSSLETLFRRDRDTCTVQVMCNGGYSPALTANHRINFGMGGSKNPQRNRLSALHLVCFLCNGWLEDNPTAAQEAGWKIPHGIDPSTVPIRYPNGRRYLLDDEGERSRVG